MVVALRASTAQAARLRVLMAAAREPAAVGPRSEAVWVALWVQSTQTAPLWMEVMAPLRVRTEPTCRSESVWVALREATAQTASPWMEAMAPQRESAALG